MAKKAIFYFSCFVFLGTAFAVPADSGVDYASVFGTRNGCFLLTDAAQEKLSQHYHPERCKQRFQPCSSFKPVLALMGFDQGLLKNETAVISWDGTHYTRPELNQDQTPITWMQYSVNWVNEWIVPKLGQEIIVSYLKKFSYGNQDFSKGEETIRISPDEQLRFWRRFWRGELPVSDKAQQATQKALFIEKLDDETTLYGKTGSCCIDAGCESKLGRQLGWFVGAVTKGDKIHVFVTNFSDTKASKEYAGGKARELTKIILARLGIIGSP